MKSPPRHRCIYVLLLIPRFQNIGVLFLYSICTNTRKRKISQPAIFVLKRTSGLKRHLDAHHSKELEAKMKQSSPSSNTLTKHYSPKKKEPALGITDIKRQFRVAATTWIIEEAIPIRMITRPTFRMMFKPLNKRWNEVVNVDMRGIREETMTMGRYAQEATLKELRGRAISWTTDHWTGPNNESYTTLTAHYIDENWSIQSALLDFIRCFMAGLRESSYMPTFKVCSRSLRMKRTSC